MIVKEAVEVFVVGARVRASTATDGLSVGCCSVGIMVSTVVGIAVAVGITVVTAVGTVVGTAFAVGTAVAVGAALTVSTQREDEKIFNN